MNRIEIPVEQYSRAIKATKPFISADQARPILHYISVRVFPDKITFFACDGFRAARYTISRQLQDSPDSSPWSCLILPFPVNVKKVSSQFKPVVITEEDSTTTVSIPTYYGTATYSVNRSSEYSLNEDKILSCDESEIVSSPACNPRYLSQVAAALTDCRAVRLHMNESPIKPIFITGAPATGEKVETILLPVRTEAI